MAAGRRPRRDLRTSSGRAADRIRTSLGADLRRYRTDAGLSLRQVGDAAAVDPSFLSLIERGLAEPSYATLAALASVLGLDPSVRLYPTTGPLIRDRHQAAIVEALLRSLAPAWVRAVEVPVHRPARGVIDAVFARPEVVIATEIHTDLRTIDQTLRWAAAKAESLPSADRWDQLSDGGRAVIDRLLVLRSTRHNRELVSAHAETFRAAYPADPHESLRALTGSAQWPGSTLLWATTHPRGVRIHARGGSPR
jgi:transcriptional regulator with XRE-family HTH domain